MSKYVTYAEVRKVYQVRPQTVQNWAKQGRIRYKAIQNATRKTWLYDLDSIGELIKSGDDEANQSESSKNDHVVIYCRVSSKKQESDLVRQRELLSKAFPNAEIMDDIGSGLNYKRHAFSKLVKRICRDEIAQVVVTFKDRLVRFGFELFEQMCEEHGTKILVYCKADELQPDHDEIELKDDLLSIVNVFVARNNGKRSALLRKQRKNQEQQKITSDTTTNMGENNEENFDNGETETEDNAEAYAKFDFESLFIPVETTT
jgi:putative resolvase